MVWPARPNFSWYNKESCSVRKSMGWDEPFSVVRHKWHNIIWKWRWTLAFIRRGNLGLPSSYTPFRYHSGRGSYFFTSVLRQLSLVKLYDLLIVRRLPKGRQNTVIFNDNYKVRVIFTSVLRQLFCLKLYWSYDSPPCTKSSAKHSHWKWRLPIQDCLLMTLLICGKYA